METHSVNPIKVVEGHYLAHCRHWINIGYHNLKDISIKKLACPDANY